MDINNKLQEMLLEQKKIEKDFEILIKEFDLENIISQNINLKKELEICRNNLEEIKRLNENLKDENSGLKIALKEQIFHEKLNIIKISREKIETYFKSADNQYYSTLYEFEEKARGKLTSLSELIRNELAKEAEIFNKEVDALTEMIKNRIKANRDTVEQEGERIVYEVNEEQRKLSTRTVSEEVVQKRIKQNNLEFKIGLNWINKIGILLILFGISYGIKYTYTTYFFDEFKAAFVFLIGISMLGGGEYLVRRGKEIFALGLSGGGIGVLYLAAHHSYFNLNVLTLEVALLIAVLITATSFVLSLRYDSRTIAGLSQVGGFIPFFTYAYTNSGEITPQFIFVSMGYLLLLNSLTVLLALNKKWNVVKYVSFILNVPTLCFLVFNTDNHTIAILYTILTFGMYLVSSIAYQLKYKTALNVWDTVLLAINTTVSCVIVYVLFDIAQLNDFRGLLAILFCATYYGLGQIVNKHLAKDKASIIIFYLTSFAFAVLAVPFQLGLKWFAMGWLIEAVLMIIMGYRNKIKYLEIGGWIVMGLCVGGVLTVDFVRYHLMFNKEAVPHFHLRYLFVIVGMLLVLFAYLIDFSRDQMQRYSVRGKLITYYKYFVVLNFWVFGIYMANSLMSRVIIPGNLIESYYYGYLYKMLFVLVTLLCAYLMLIIPLIRDKVVSIFVNILLGISIFSLIILNFSEPIWGSQFDNFKYVAMGLLLIVNVVALLNFHYLVIRLVKIKAGSIEILPIALCLYMLFNVTGVLVYQFDLGNINVLYSIIYLIAALACVVFGFYKRYVTTRRFGLGLAVFAIAKLFMFDLSNLTLGGKIVSYISFGLILLGISYMYQKFNKLADQIGLAMMKDEQASNKSSQ